MAKQRSAGELVTIFGGPGFVGRYATRELAERGWRIRAASRRPDLAGHLQPMGAVGQIHPVQAPLVEERRRSGCGNGERGRAALRNG